jgi:uncharacterized damage-inducible protein DinB
MAIAFETLFSYNDTCNRKLTAIFTSAAVPVPESSLRLYSHILNAHHIWNQRITGKGSAFGVWEVHNSNALEAINLANHEATAAILSQGNLQSNIHYYNTQGQGFSNSVQDILFHIINHSTYHRGQLALDFRQNGLTPVVTDYIFYMRSEVGD